MLSNQSTPITIAIAGSTVRTTQVAQAINQDSRFQVVWVLTPSPRPVGRKQIVTLNPLHTWAKELTIPVIEVEKNIAAVREQIKEQPRPDIVLVVDFGYFIPKWLLELPSVAPINIHPSALPKWRGSSPGQFTVLSGETTSAVSVIVVNSAMDQGPIIKQLSFSVEKTWTQADYYEYAFNLISQEITTILSNFVSSSQSASQPVESPTAIARRLSKSDSFVSWEQLMAAMQPHASSHSSLITIPHAIIDQPVLETMLASHPSELHPTILEHACRAFNPWPLLWTIAPTSHGEKRLQILECTINANNALELKTVKIEGLSAKPWHELKNYFFST
jgi:methionyl-tRNA formyltransferase